MTALLDVNVLIALFDAEHIHYETAHDWFESTGRGLWATCPLTENGFVRIVSSPRYPGRRTTVAETAERLRRSCHESDDHVFWPDSLSLRDQEHFTAAALRGYRQITDVYLLALAVHNDGVLTTFDDSIPTAAVPGAGDNRILLLK